MDNIKNESFFSKPMIEAINLVKKYEDGHTALKGVNFQVFPGQIFALLGGNGAGKTTSINLFLNLIEPTEGSALINGIVSHKEPLEAKKNIAFVSENVMLYPDFTALQNLDFFSKIAGKANYTKKDYHKVLERVGLQQEAHNKKLKEFSKGMRQKCGIAVAILKDAPAILLDEPTSGLDPKAGMEFSKLLDELKTEGKAILMSTHDIFRAKEIADVIGIMKEGEFVMIKTKEELIDENLEELYVKYMSGQKNDHKVA